MAVSENYTLSENTTLAVTRPGVLANDSDVDGDALFVAGYYSASHGTVGIFTDGTFNYKPDANYVGADSFIYALSDGHGDSSRAFATVNLTVTAPPAVTVDQSAILVQDGDTTIDTGTFAGDPNTGAVTISASLGTITQTAGGSGTWSWSLGTSDATASQTVTITATDSVGGVSTTSFNLVVNNPAPVISSLTSSNPDAAHAAVNTPVTISGIFTDAGTLDTHHAVIDWGDGTDTLLGANAVDEVHHTFTGSHLYSAGGTYTIAVTLDDNHGGSASQSVQAAVAVVGLHGNVLEIDGTDGGDDIRVHRSGNNLVVQAVMGTFVAANDADDDSDDDDIPDSNAPQYQRFVFNAASVHSIVIHANGGDDLVSVNQNVLQSATIDGGAGNDDVRGGGGDDTIVDFTGNNTVRSGQGNNTIILGNGNNLVDTSGGNDTITSGNGANEIHAGQGNDSIAVGDGANLVYTGGGDDAITAGNGNNEIHASQGNNTITIGNGNNLVYADGGNDVITAGDGSNAIHAGQGTNVIVVGGGGNSIWTNGGIDSIRTGNGNNQIHAGGGDDTIVTGSGNDEIWTGGGNDVIDAGDGDNEIHAGNGDNRITTGSGNDSIWSGGGNDVINAGNGNNIVHGGAGNDTIVTGSGDDQIWCEGGNDVVNAGDGNNTIDAGAGDDYVIAGAGSDVIDGGAGNDILIGGAGNDQITGGAGNDLLIGGFGADQLTGGAGDDVLIGGSVTLGQAGLEAALAAWTSTASYDARRLQVEAILISGTTAVDDGAADVLTGNAGQDLFYARLSGSAADVVKDKASNESTYGL